MPPPTPAATSTRLLSLDAFRGLVIVIMFLVNVAGTDPAFPKWFPHRGWNSGHMGNGLADFVFPWFLFIVGVAIPLSMTSGRGRDLPAWRKLLAALRRGATIYLLGTLIWCAFIAYKPTEPGAAWAGPIDWKVLLHWDILPLCGFGYFLAAVLYLVPGRVASVAVRVAMVLAVLTFKWWALKGSTPPEYASWIECLEKKASLQDSIKSQLGWWGVLLTQGMAASAVVVLGSLAGDVLVSGRKASVESPRAFAAEFEAPASGPAASSPLSETLRRPCLALVIAGAVVCALGLAWHFAGFLSSKDYFTSSYVLITAGSACAVLGAMVYIVDCVNLTTFTFLRVFGSNALAVYVAAEFLWKTVMTRWEVVLPTPAFEPGSSAWLITAWKAWIINGPLPHGPKLGPWVHVATYTLAYWCLCLWMYRRNLFLRV